MPFLRPERFRRLIHRQGEFVLVFSSTPLASRAAGQGTYVRGQTPALQEGQALLHGYIYRPVFPIGGIKVWINKVTRSRGKTAGGIMEGSNSEVSWMPDEVSLAAPDLIVRIEQENTERDITTLPYDGEMLDLSRPYVFSVEGVSKGGCYWKRGEHFECVSAGQTIGVLRGAGVILLWNSEERPAPGTRATVDYRFHPVMYFSGEIQQGGVRSRVGPRDSLSSLLPRNGNLSFIHPDDSIEDPQ